LNFTRKCREDHRRAIVTAHDPDVVSGPTTCSRRIAVTGMPDQLTPRLIVARSAAPPVHGDHDKRNRASPYRQESRIPR
jgi:hypothetical protein